ncbi:MAG: tyrosine-type recombinase/integrase [Candidatus Saccharibacteria bacterium]|nr:tyrosine-type recombinase/integrase [Moraxellaceae bacterium]
MSDLESVISSASNWSLATKSSLFVPAIIAATGPAGTHAFIEFFVATLRNSHTRLAYAKAVSRFSAWLETDLKLTNLRQLQAWHIATYIEQMLKDGLRPATVKQSLSAIRQLCDFLVVRQVLPVNPATSVKAPKQVNRHGLTPVLLPEEARAILDMIDISTIKGLRDRALIATMAYTFARISATLALKVGDYQTRGRRAWLRFVEKGGQTIDLPCHHLLETYLDEYLAQADLIHNKKALLFCSMSSRSAKAGLSDISLLENNVWTMVNARARAAGIDRPINCHTFRATGITAYLKNGGRLEIAQQMAGHASPTTTQLYDRRDDDVALDEVERILI